MNKETLDPAEINEAKEKTMMKEWRETALGSLSAQSMQDYTKCVEFAAQCLLSLRSSEYVRALEKGFLTEVDPCNYIVYNVPVTRTNIQRVLGIGVKPPSSPPTKKQKMKGVFSFPKMVWR